MVFFSDVNVVYLYVILPSLFNPHKLSKKYSNAVQLEVYLFRLLVVEDKNKANSLPITKHYL